MTKEELKEIQRVYGKDFEQSDIPAYIRKRDEEMLGKKKIIQIWDDDRGWVHYCENCGKPLSRDSVENGKICPFCFIEFGKIERV